MPPSPAPVLRQGVNHAATCVLVSLGHRAGLFTVLAAPPPPSAPSAHTAFSLARAAGNLHPRPVYEWLCAMTVCGILDSVPPAPPATPPPSSSSSRSRPPVASSSSSTHQHQHQHQQQQQQRQDHFRLPPEHAQWLTWAPVTCNFALVAQTIPALARLQPALVACFRRGAGLPATAFRELDAVAKYDAVQTLAPRLLPVLRLAPALLRALCAGVRVLCLAGPADPVYLRLARMFPRSWFLCYTTTAAAAAASATLAGSGCSVAGESAADGTEIDVSGSHTHPNTNINANINSATFADTTNASCDARSDNASTHSRTTVPNASVESADSPNAHSSYEVNSPPAGRTASNTTTAGTERAQLPNIRFKAVSALDAMEEQAVFDAALILDPTPLREQPRPHACLRALRRALRPAAELVYVERRADPDLKAARADRAAPLAFAVATMRSLPRKIDSNAPCARIQATWGHARALDALHFAGFAPVQTFELEDDCLNCVLVAQAPQ